MKIAALFLVLISLPLLAQNRPTTIEEDHFECHYFGYKKMSSPQDICNFLSFRSNQHAEEVVDRIIRQVGLTRNFVVVECPNTQNCFATVVEGQRYIVYDGEFMKRVENETHTDWGAISIVAHEIGHHLQGHTIDGKGSRPQKELEADKFSGFVMHQLGASLDEATITIQTFGDEKATFSHPVKTVRIEAIRKGWQEAEAIFPKAGIKKEELGSKTQKSNTKTASSKPPMPVIIEEEEEVETGCVQGNCESGIGIYVLESEERYEGQFRNGKRNGRGVQYYPDGTMRYNGDFKNDIRDGYGAYYFSNGDKVVGIFADNKPNGKATYYYADGDRFVGIYQNGQRNGAGNYYHRNGRKESGFYEDDEKVR
jgi:antitoxin component YwqK of YwqJK toxin-antitoxin module